ncbi:hypothetical protein Zmor_011526 [Zophobas morio]|uniref:Heat shock protein 70 n=1 Tax=Zophobas morio TaxID=2755281 RepID=A0AA38IKU5_9CUCU|nr:hypothetical protein Zmor_011526 [Zophobas morio]
MEDLVIGIDLGTTNCCASVYLNDQTKVLENDSGQRITPSFVFFTDLDTVLVGEHAKGMAESKPKNGIYALKRLIGKKYGEAKIQHKLNYLPFQIESNSSDDPVIVIQQQNKILKKTPQELCTVILEKLKKDVEKKLEQEVNKVVITVPAYFNIIQREATLAAAKDAGFTVLKLLNEPTAAALIYYHENNSSESNYSLVYDLGGGTFDVAVLKRNKHNIEIVCVNGDTNLGGQDFDNLLVDYVSEKLKELYNFDPKERDEDVTILRDKCVAAKKTLSFVEQTTISLISFVENQRKVDIHLKREEFENIANDLFRRTIQIVDNCLKDSEIPKDTIDEVILSGGSTRIPKIQNMLSDYFEGKKLNKFVNPDECVAEGAAIQAAMLSKNSKQKITKIRLTDVIPLSIGTEDLVNRMVFLIKRNTSTPASGTSTFTTTAHNQSGVLITIYEGERSNVKNNRILGEMTLTDLTPAPPGECKVTISLDVDESGILTVSAQEQRQHGENSKELKINYVRGIRSEEEVKNTLTDAEESKEEDERFERFAERNSYLIRYCEGCLYNLDAKNIREKYRSIYEACRETRNKAVLLNPQEEDIVEELTKNIKTQCEHIVKELNFDCMPHFIDIADLLKNIFGNMMLSGSEDLHTVKG